VRLSRRGEAAGLTGCFFFGEAHTECSPVDLHTVEFLYSPLCTCIIGHRDKAITFAFAGVLVRNDWNFVATDKELINAAKQKWIAQTFDKIKGDETEFVPYPTFNKK
jgi:hypothetical protein